MKWPTKLVLVLSITFSLHLISYFSETLTFFDSISFDQLSRLQPLSTPPENLATVVVEIDESSLNELGQWPWPRILLAQAINNIAYQRPAAIGLDIFFPESDRTSLKQIASFYNQRMGLNVSISGLPDRLSDNDLIFADALKSGPTLLPVFASKSDSVNSCKLPDESYLPLPSGLDLPTVKNLLCNTPTLQHAAQNFGFVNATIDPDGIFRRQPMIMNFNGKALPSLALAMLRQLDPKTSIKTLPGRTFAEISFAGKQIPINQNGEVLNHLYSKNVFNKVSIADVIFKNVGEDFFSGKFVLIGATAAGLFDQYMTPQGEILPGVFIHAALIENILNNRVIYQPEATKKIALLLSFLCSMLVVWLVIEKRYLTSWLFFIAATIFSIMFAWAKLGSLEYVSLGYFLAPFTFLFFIISLFFAVLHYVERKRFLEDLGDAHSATIDSMTMVAESRDVETGAHILRTKEYLRLLANYLYKNTRYGKNLTPHIIDLLYRAAPLHDIGKVGIPDYILQKPGALDSNEIEIMRTHVNIGRSIIDNAINRYNKTNEFLNIASNLAYTHHEKWDGTGYPVGLMEKQIPLEGRMMALVDVYDALVSCRCYRAPMSFESAEKMIEQNRGKHFDPVLVDAFTKLKREFRIIAHQYKEEFEEDIYHFEELQIPEI